jgi:hypothetical protein
LVFREDLCKTDDDDDDDDDDQIMSRKAAASTGLLAIIYICMHSTVHISVLVLLS